MQIAIVKRQPKRRCRIPRRPHPDLEYFFGRYESERCEANDNVKSEAADLDHQVRLQRRY